MTSVPEAIIERRAERERWAQYNREKILDLQRGLDLIEAELVAIDMCIAAIEDAAKTPSAEAVGGQEASAAVVQAPEAEIAPAGTGEDFKGTTIWRGLAEIKKPRAPKRDIRGMVLEYVEHGGENVYQDEIWRLLGVTPRAVASAIAYWQAKGRLTLDGGVVRLHTNVPIEDVHGILKPDPVEITGQGVDVYFIASELEGTVVANLRRKEVEVPDGIGVDAAAE